ncbi:aldehyde dehydrogenase [Rubrobacter taiwanensis]|jgi:acyl-CoA reductase-like NAD-dependent aldehyde dehydrogenase|uniref:Aldehyde dehydrogenase n=1 Tax=Rubrobacter taiwanensis TaxID=185139 RepID=A0A4R1BS94_9ACTN|nr:aldehyde dehydrogenase family protein [Rubrobacter taiwanensis]TCJ20095.1 aldehyde dehydrogenase [Rubrobacter taiwanensis]
MQIQVRDYPMYVAGEWIASEARMEATSPATGERIGTVPEGTREDVRRAIAAANRAWPAWAARSAFERAAALERVAEIIRERREELARTLTLDQGKPLAAEAYDEVDELIVYFRQAAADTTRFDGALPPSVDAGKRVLLYRVPRGVVGVISPWNWPYTMPAEVIAPALATGNAVVWTPAPSTSVCSVKLAECIVDAGLPAGLFNMITGQGPVVGDEVASNPGTHAVAFIGSVETGRQVARRAAGKQLLLEMGGNGPVVILDDADLDAAVKASLTSAFLCAGQSCTAGERFLVHERVHDAFLEKLAAAVEHEVRLGDPFAPETTLGPMNNEPTAQKMDRHVTDALQRGAELVTGGARAEEFPTRLYYRPTVLKGVTEEMQVAQEETFGPVAPVTAIRSEEDALRTVDGSPYGLLAAVWTRDLVRGLRFAERVRTGWVNINASSNHWESHLPFGGRSGSASGIGRVGGRYPMETFTEMKTVVVSLE